MSPVVRRWSAAGALLVVGFLAGGGRATLYHGVGFPDDPYRYAGRVPAPSAVQRTVALPARSGDRGPTCLS